MVAFCRLSSWMYLANQWSAVFSCNILVPHACFGTWYQIPDTFMSWKRKKAELSRHPYTVCASEPLCKNVVKTITNYNLFLFNFYWWEQTNSVPQWNIKTVKGARYNKRRRTSLKVEMIVHFEEVRDRERVKKGKLKFTCERERHQDVVTLDQQKRKSSQVCPFTQQHSDHSLESSPVKVPTLCYQGRTGWWCHFLSVITVQCFLLSQAFLRPALTYSYSDPITSVSIVKYFRSILTVCWE